MTQLLFLLLLFPQLPGVLGTVTTGRDQTVLAGQSITIPCSYNPEYTLNVKYWCQGSVKDFCTSLARTDQTQSGRITIADDPTQYVFTVTMRDLEEQDSAWYWCGVEIGGIWTKDSTTSLYISVKQGISVQSNQVSAEEGASVSVQFLYSQKHREHVKKWCRSGSADSCKVTNNGTFSSESLLISDDGKDTVTVTMRKLEMRDAGWYYCGAGEHHVPVQVLVIPRTTTTAVNGNAHLSEIKSQDSDSHNVWKPVLITCGVLLLLLTAVGVAWAMWKYSRVPTENRTLESSSLMFLNNVVGHLLRKSSMNDKKERDKLKTLREV